MAAAGLRFSCLPRSLSAVCARPRLPSSWSPARCLGSGASAREQFLYTRPGLKSKIIDGKKIAEAVKAEVADEVTMYSIYTLYLLYTDLQLRICYSSEQLPI